MTLATLFAVLYGLVLACLFAFGVNGYVLLVARRRWRPPPAPPVRRWPHVTVQLPIYNERDVVERLLGAAAALRYPGRLDIQLLDDSTDDTSAIAHAAIARLASDVRVDHVRRSHRVGFKAGALARGLERTDAELVLILDADFVPEPDLLLRAVPVLLADERNACVQTRWEHLNRGRSPLTRGQALGIDVHFFVEQRARAAAGWPVAFNGSGGVWRRAAMEDAGGWSADTLTEDLDLSYRAWLRGWRIAYADDVPCPAEIPERMADFKAQQRRWARGSTAVAVKLLGRVWRSEVSLGAKVQSVLHLTHYAVHPLMLMSAALALPLGLLAASGSAWWSVLPPLAMATGGPVSMALAASAGGRVRKGRRARDLGVMVLLGTGLAVSNSLAVFAGLRGGGVFERTPKGGGGSSYRLLADPLGLLEIGAALGCAALAGWLASLGIVAMVPFLLLYAAGLGWVGTHTLREASVARAQARTDALEVEVR